MKCENIQFNLPIYADDILTADERRMIDKHLAQCPLCRQKLSDFQTLRQDLRVLPRPELPVELLVSMRRRVAGEIKSAERKQNGVFSEDVRRWLQMRLMPYGVATVLSLTFGFALLSSMLSVADKPVQTIEIAKAQTYNRPPVLTSNGTPAANVDDFELTPANYAAERFSVSGDSPSLNPNGALIALTKSLVRGSMKDDEVVVVADVFGDGLARIAEVIEPSRNRSAVRELEKALKNNDFNDAPFVPAVMDNRSDTVRVVLKIQRVDIQTHSKK